MGDLFSKKARDLARQQAPLAERMRPESLADVVGQEHLTGPEGPLGRLLESSGRVPNLILWGPPGTGKTTLARLVAGRSGAAFETLSATNSGVKDIRELLDRARLRLGAEGRATVVFIDEIHRFNKAQQDSLLHAAEDGLIALIGATTENPSFEVNAALLSRCRVQVLKPLDDAALGGLLDRALENSEHGLGKLGLALGAEARETLLRFSDGDARKLLLALEAGADQVRGQPEGEREITPEALEQALGRKLARYDKKADGHYDLASAMIKSVRGSDPDAAIYYMMRMLDAGEEPRFVARRLAILASEDIGNADPGALNLAASTIQVVNFIGMPEAVFALCQLAAYLSLAPKSNATLRSMFAARRAIREKGDQPIPLKIRNAPARLMKDLGYGANYAYAHDFEDGFAPERFLPEAVLADPGLATIFEPSRAGFEARLAERLAELRRRIEEAGQDAEAEE